MLIAPYATSRELFDISMSKCAEACHMICEHLADAA